MFFISFLAESSRLRDFAQTSPPSSCQRVSEELSPPAGVRGHLAVPEQRLQQRHLPESLPSRSGTNIRGGGPLRKIYKTMLKMQKRKK